MKGVERLFRRCEINGDRPNQNRKHSINNFHMHYNFRLKFQHTHFKFSFLEIVKSSSSSRENILGDESEYNIIILDLKF